MFQKILVGVDGSESALRAVSLGGTLSQTFDAQLVLVHVVQISAIAEQAINMSATEHLKENPKSIMEKLSQEVLEKARRQANEAGVRDDHIEKITVDGDQARQLIQIDLDARVTCCTTRLTGLNFRVGSIFRRRAISRGESFEPFPDCPDFIRQ